MINRKTQLNAVVGIPLEHSLSPLLHNFIYEKMGINAVMLAFSKPDIEQFMQAFRSLPIQLCSVTKPYKQQIISFLDVVDPMAKQLNSVNTVINREGKLYGYNTDIVGIEKTLGKTSLDNKKVLILGAGAVAQTVCFYMKNKRARLFCHNRTFEKADYLMEIFSGEVCTKETLPHIKFDLIINTTSIGMFPKEDESPVPENILQPKQLVFDVIYNPLQTRLLQKAAERGAKTLSGLTMFIEQALEQIRLWSAKELPAYNYHKFLMSFLCSKNDQ